jgi:hypothetical protein
MHVLLTNGVFAGKSASVGHPAPERETFVMAPNGRPEKLEAHVYRKIGVEPNHRGEPLAIYVCAD